VAGLFPAIHVFGSMKEDVDARDKRGHDASFRVARRLRAHRKNGAPTPAAGRNTPVASSRIKSSPFATPK
jgi:hypothetical protein